MAGVVGFEPTVHGIKTRGYCYQELSGKSRKLLSKLLSKNKIDERESINTHGEKKL